MLIEVPALAETHSDRTKVIELERFADEFQPSDSIVVEGVAEPETYEMTTTEVGGYGISGD